LFETNTPNSKIAKYSTMHSDSELEKKYFATELLIHFKILHS
jgi:hypothetical protein